MIYLIIDFSEFRNGIQLTINLLDRKFFERETILVAKEMIGKKLVRLFRSDSKIIKLAGIIVETEAYGYLDDQASHAFNGINSRNKYMFGNVGYSYVYFTYGNHYCFNVSAHTKTKDAGAVLIRAIEPIVGINMMIKNRKKIDILNLTSGPGKMTQALAIDLKDNGLDITDHKSDIYLEESIMPDAVLSTKRIGIGIDKDKYWRFIYAKKNRGKVVINRYVSRKKENSTFLHDYL